MYLLTIHLKLIDFHPLQKGLTATVMFPLHIAICQGLALG